MKKNKKMVLALAVVAALAMVSVAAVALQGNDSDAAGTYIEMKTGNNIIVDQPSTISYDFYIDKDAVSGFLLFTVTENATFSGTLRIGTLSADNEYTPFCTIVLTDASAVNITAAAYNSDMTGFVSFFMIGNSSKDATVMPGGTYELTQGQVVLGSATTDIPRSSWQELSAAIEEPSDIMGILLPVYSFFTNEAENFVPFNGTVSAGDNFSVTSSYVVGAIIAVTDDGSARISGFAASPNEVLPQDEKGEYPKLTERTLSMNGTASIQYPEAIQKAIDMNMEALSSVGSDYEPFLSDIFATNMVNVTIEEGSVITAGDREPVVAEEVTVESGTDLLDGKVFLIDGDGRIYTPSETGTETIFRYIPLTSYTFVAVNSGGEVYYGTATISGSDTEYTLSLSKNTLTDDNGAMDSDDLEMVEGEITFNSADYRFTFAITIIGGKPLLGSVTEDGIISFDEDLTDEEVIVFMKSTAAGSPLKYYEGAVGSNDATGIMTLAKGDPEASEIKAGDVTISSTIVSYIVTDTQSTLTVKGEMNFIYTSEGSRGIIDITNKGDAAIVFEGTGIISIGVMPKDKPDIPEGLMKGNKISEKLVAAYYYVNEGEPVKKSTYYFTTLANAITKNNEITLTGKHVILVDTTLDYPEFDTIRVILGEDAELEVGDKNTNANLIIPAKTEVVVRSDAGGYRVINGQAIYDVMPTPAENEPQADVMIEGDKFIYTDIATALDISVSGDVLELRQDADLIRDATVKDGVELKDAPGASLTILEEVELTVDGKLTSTQNMVINGRLVINKEVIFTDGAFATLGPEGYIDITASGVLTITGGSTIRAESDGQSTINVTGKIDVQNDSEVYANNIYVTGEVLANGMLTALGELVIGEKPTLSTGYVNSANISGKISLGTDAIAYVYGDFPMSNKLLVEGELLKTEYMIESTIYVTLYAGSEADSETILLPLLYEDQLKDIQINDWNNERQLRGESLSAELRKTDPQSLIGADNWKIVYANFEYRMYDVTFSYLQGMTWVVNGENLSGGVTKSFKYGESITVTGVVQPGFEGTPAIKANGNSYIAGTPFIVEDNAIFEASGVQQASGGGGDDGKGGLTLIEYLLIIIVIIIAVIAIIVAIRLLRS